MTLDSTVPNATGVATTAPVFNADDSFFSKKGTEYTYVNSVTMNYSPSSTINNSTLTFDVPKLSSPNCAFINDMMLHLMVKLTDSKGEKPPDKANVAPCNLFTANIFRSVRLFLNEVEVSSGESGLYGLRCYINLVTGLDFSSKVGGSQMLAFIPDRPGEFQLFDSSANGFLQRQLLFGDIMPPTEEDPGIYITYHDKPVPFYCRVVTDFSSCTLPLISGVNWGVSID